MKKNSSKRILSVILTLALVLSMGDAALAAEPEQAPEAEVQQAPEAEVQEPEAQEAEEQAPEAEVQEPEQTPEAEVQASETAAREIEEAEPISLLSNEIKPMASGSVPVLWSVTGQEQPTAGIVVFSNNDKKVNGNYYGYSQPVDLLKGTFVLAVANDTNSCGSVYYGLWEDEDLTREAVPKWVLTRGESEGRLFQISENKRYYIGVYGSPDQSQDINAWRVGISAAVYNGGDREIKNGQIIGVGQRDSQTNYFKFVAPYTGYIQTYGDPDAAYNKVALCDSSKNALSGDTGLRYNPTYGVTKGKTYYIRVNASYNSNGLYTFRVNSTKISEKSGKKKAKAVTLKKKKAKSGTLQAGSGQADWYKFKLSGKKKVKITVSGRTNDQMKVIVYKGGKKIVTRTIYYSDAKLTLKSVGKWTKGTYYIKIQRGNGTSSGYYSVKWK